MPAAASRPWKLCTPRHQRRSLASAMQAANTLRTDQTNKAMIFIDGTWFYYSFILGYADCPVQAKYGSSWFTEYRINYRELPSVIAGAIEDQLQCNGRHKSFVDVARTHFYTGTLSEKKRHFAKEQMIKFVKESNFMVTELLSLGNHEKGVDVSLAMDMLYLSSIPSAYDIAIIVTGDQDFCPLLEKTRLSGKSVAICSMRNSCSPALQQYADFDIVWLEDHMDKLLERDCEISICEQLAAFVTDMLEEVPGGMISGRNLGRRLQIVDPDLSSRVRESGGLKSQLKRLDDFEVKVNDENAKDFTVYSSSTVSEKALKDYKEAYEAETVATLKDFCRERKLKVSGTKSELVQRLVDSHK